MPALDPIIRIAWAPSVMRDRRAQPFDDNLRQRVLQWEYTDKAEGADKGKLTLDNSDLALWDLEALKPDSRLYVQWGYPHSMHPVRAITIEKVKGFRKIEIEGSVTEARQFLGVQKTRTWENTTEFEVAEEIARDMGFRESRSRRIEEGDVTVERRGLTQSGETDMAFLLRIAARIGCTFFITDGIFHFHERSLGSAPVRTVTYWNDRDGEIIGDPDIEHNIQGRPGSVSRRGRSPRERRDTSGSASNREDRSRHVLGEELPCSDPNGVDWDSLESDLGITVHQSIMPSEEEAQSDVSPTSAETDAEATSEARQRFRASERSTIKMSITLVGAPDIQADNNIRVEGIGQKYSGNYHVDEAVHTVSAGQYRTKLKLKRNATSRSGGTARSRRRIQQQATSAIPAGADLPYSSEFNVWDSQGSPNIDDPPDTSVRQVETTDADGESVMRYDAQGRGESRMPDPWEESW